MIHLSSGVLTPLELSYLGFEPDTPILEYAIQASRAILPPLPYSRLFPEIVPMDA